MQKFTFFWKGPLSQWQKSPFRVGDIVFTHAEQFMMYGKAVLFGDQANAAKILQSTSPREQQAIGRVVQGYVQSTWDMFREGIVYQANYAKFSQHADLKELLFATRGTTLVEASPMDRVWGIGLAEDHPWAQDPAQWQGLNLLGKTLTRVREALWWEQEAGL